MNTGRLLAEALRLVRRRAVLGAGVLVALCGLTYAALYLAWQGADPTLLNDFTATLPPAAPLWALGAALILLAGGLLSEARLILAAARAGEPAALRPPRGAALRRLPALLGVALLVWWPALPAGALALAPVGYGLLGAAPEGDGAGLLAFCGVACAGLLGALATLLLWPLQRLANCALLLDALPPRVAVRAARRVFFGHFGDIFGLWAGLIVLTVGLWLLSALLAALAAGLVYGLWLLLDGAPEGAALAVAGVVALALGLALLVWDGAVSAFTVGAWVGAYREFRVPVAPVVLSRAPAAAPAPPAARPNPEQPPQPT
jgi:hypothetical protein